MKKVSELKAILSEEFNWNKARIDCFSRLLLALFAVRTVNLSELAVGFSASSQVSSRYKRLQRFFGQFKFDYTMLARWIVKLFFVRGTKIYLTLDRTNWWWGKQKLNVFMLAIAYEGIAIPIFWQLLPKAGSSSFVEQQRLIKRFLDEFGQDDIVGLLADREFGSGDLFKWLNQQNIPFYIRIKENSVTHVKARRFYTAKKLFNHLNVKQASIFHMDVELFGAKVYLAGSRSERGELMIVATNAIVKNAIAIYLRRWEIETLFQSLKGRGFRFEDTHMTSLERVEKLMAVLAVGFCWAHKIGEYKAKMIKAIRNIKHRVTYRPQNNFFRYGFDHVRELILNPIAQFSLFLDCIALLYQLPSPYSPEVL